MLVSWKTTEIAKLRALYPSASRDEFLAAVPHRSWNAIKHQALRQGFRRDAHFTTAPNELRDAVRKRAREDRISLGQLGAQTGCGAYFLDGGGKTVDQQNRSGCRIFWRTVGHRLAGRIANLLQAKVARSQ
jgi:hypothetical protein